MQKNTFQKVIENLPDAYVEYDARGNFVACNGKHLALYPEIADQLVPGAARSDLLTAYARSKPSPIVHQDPEEWLREHLDYIAEPRVPRDRPLADGRWIRATEHRTDSGGIVGLTSDITDLIRREENVRRQEVRFRMFAESASDWFWEMDENLRFTFISDNVERILGVAPDWHYGKTRQELFGKGYEPKTWDAHLAILKERRPFRDFVYLRVGEGLEPKWLSVSGIPFFNAQGAFQGYRGSARDITVETEARLAIARSEVALKREVEERRRAEASTKASLSRFRGIFDNSHIGMVIVNETGHRLQWNQSFQDMLGYSDEEILGSHVDKFTHPDDLEVSRELQAQWVDKGADSARREKRFLRKDGSVLWGDVSLSLLGSNENDERIVIAQILDITEQKAAERTIRENEERFQDFAEAASDWFWEMDENLRFTKFYDQRNVLGDTGRLRFIGRTRQEVAGSDPDDARWQDHLVALEARKPFRDFRYTVKDIGPVGHEWSISGAPFFDDDGTFKGYRGTGTDITARTRMESKIAEQSALLQQILDYLPVSVALFDEDGRYIFINEYGAAKTNRSVDDFVGRRGEDIFGIPAELTFGNLARQVARTGVPIVNKAFQPTQWPKREALLNAVPYYGISGALSGVLLLAQDVTDQMRAEVAVREQEALLATIVEHLPANLMLKDLQGRYQLVNNAFAERLGFAKQDIIGKTIFEITGDAARSKAIQSHTQKVIDTRRSVVEDRKFEGEGDGQHRRVTKFPVFDRDGNIVSVGTISLDTTEQNRIEQQLRQAQKMEGVGQLTGGIAHDFNNLLGVVIGNLDFLAEKVAKKSELHELIVAATRAALHGAELTRQLLAFSRQQPLAPKPLDLNRQIGSILELLRRTLGETIDVELVRGDGLWLCEADPSQVEAALLNLAINARDAMPTGGTLMVETANIRLDSDYADTQNDVKPGSYVMLAVTDTGKGMSAETTRRAFEPFYTTKRVGEGSGLGLSMVFGFAKQSGGHVSIYSEEGHGTTIKLYLPRRSTGNASDVRHFSTTKPQIGQGQVVLLVEDDPDLRTLTANQLRDLDYRVLEAGDGSTALELSTASEHVDLLLTDVVLPGGMGGTILAKEIQRRLPNVKILYMSGYTENAVMRRGRMDTGVSLLQKPFRIADLARMAHDVLNAN